MKVDTANLRDSLGAVAVVTAGYSFRGSLDDLQLGDVSVLQMRNVDAEVGVNWNDVQCVELPSKRIPAFLAAHDIVFTTRGARNFALALGEVPDQAVCSPHFFVIRVRERSRPCSSSEKSKPSIQRECVTEWCARSPSSCSFIAAGSAS